MKLCEQQREGKKHSDYHAIHCYPNQLRRVQNLLAPWMTSPEESTGNRDTLLFATAELQAALAHHCVVPIAHACDGGVQPGFLGSRLNFLTRRANPV
jgi:hypothetical protein